MTGITFNLPDAEFVYHARSLFPAPNNLIGVFLLAGDAIDDALDNKLAGVPDAIQSGTVPITATDVMVGPTNYIDTGIGASLAAWSAAILYHPDDAGGDHMPIGNYETAGNHGDGLSVSTSGGVPNFAFATANRGERTTSGISMVDINPDPGVTPNVCMVAGVWSASETSLYVGKAGVVTKSSTLGSTRTALSASTLRLGRGAGTAFSTVARKQSYAMIWEAALTEAQIVSQVFPHLRDIAAQLGLTGV